MWGLELHKRRVVQFLLIALVVLLPLSALQSSHSEAESTEGSWVTKAPMHEARAYPGVAVVNGKIYAIGGDTGDLIGNLISEGRLTGMVVSINEEYNPAMDTWTVKAPMPTPRVGFGIAVYENKIYCMGGYTKDGLTKVNEVYDPATDSWETKAPMPTARGGLMANVVNGKIYVLSLYMLSLDDKGATEVYDPTTDAWITKTPPPYIITSFASAVVDNKIYFVGASGYDPDGTYSGSFILVYNPVNDNWSIGASSPTYGVWTTGASSAKRFYIFEKTVTHVYDMTNQSWAVGASMPTARVCAGVAVVNAKFYVVGGRTGMSGYIVSMGPSATNEQYTPIGYGAIPFGVSVLSPQNNGTYAFGNISLVFEVNKPAVWMGYSLDGQETVTVTGNTTISGLTNGVHNVTVYAKDAFENTGASETVSFSVEVPFPATLVIAPIASVAVIGAVLAIYFKKRKH
jgi:N-acetylneuraminic acid mutarotase